MIYLDTSALIKLYLLENGSESVHALVTSQDEPLPVWELQEAELINAFRLKVFWKELTEDEADHQIKLFYDRKRRGFYFMPDMSRSRMSDDFKQLSLHTQTIGCRTMDILHVACALQLKAERFATFDERQRVLAQQAGLPVWAPEKD